MDRASFCCKLLLKIKGVKNLDKYKMDIGHNARQTNTVTHFNSFHSDTSETASLSTCRFVASTLTYHWQLLQSRPLLPTRQDLERFPCMGESCTQVLDCLTKRDEKNE